MIDLYPGNNNDNVFYSEREIIARNNGANGKRNV